MLRWSRPDDVHQKIPTKPSMRNIARVQAYNLLVPIFTAVWRLACRFVCPVVWPIAHILGANRRIHNSFGLENGLDAVCVDLPCFSPCGLFFCTLLVLFSYPYFVDPQKAASKPFSTFGGRPKSRVIALRLWLFLTREAWPRCEPF